MLTNMGGTPVEPDGDKSMSVRVKEAAEQYSGTKTALLYPETTKTGKKHPMAGQQVRDFDGNPALLSELDALIAYMQMLGTLVDFDSFRAEGANLR